MPYCTACGVHVEDDDAVCAACAADEPSSSTRSEGDEETDLFERGSVRFALGYPFSGGSKPFLLNSGLVLVGVVFPVLWLFTAGYVFRLLGAAARGQREGPPFDDYRRLFVDGVRLTAATLAFGGVAVAVGATLFAISEQPAVPNVVGGFLVGLTAVAGLYLFPAVVTIYAATGRATAAFSQSHVVAFATDARYAVGAVGWIVAVVAGLVTSLFALVTVVGALAVPFVLVATASIVAANWGYQYWRSDSDALPRVEREASGERPRVDLRR